MHYFYFIRKFISLPIIIFFCGQTVAQTTDQNYPVTAQAFVVGQSGKKLSAYFSNTQALTVSLLLKDLTKNNIDVYLRWSIDGPGVRIASVDGYIPPAFISLQRGMLQRFSGLDLQSTYFRQDLIETQGLPGPALRSSLPEGFYTFRVQALEAGTGREVSNLGETYFSITSPLPPMINLPFNGAVLASTSSATGSLSLSKGAVKVQWMPRHYKIPGNITSYDLKVCKIPDGYRGAGPEPQEAMDACVNPIIDDRGNPGTFYPANTGIGNSIIGDWEQGARYAVRVTVHEFDQSGDEVVFANEGRSEVTWFRYGDLCRSPESFTIKEIGPGRVVLKWEAQSGTDNYKILWHALASTNSATSVNGVGEIREWQSQTVSGTTGTVLGLGKGKYEFAVQSGCTKSLPDRTQTYEIGLNENGGSIYTTPAIVRVDGLLVDSLSKLFDSLPKPCASQISVYEGCSAETPVVNPVGSVPLQTLSPGDFLTIYDMAVIVTSSSGTESFSGKGLARLPFLKNVLTPVEFSNVRAWKGEEGTKGGCVYQVDGYFRTYSPTKEISAQPTGPEIDTLLAKIRYVVVNPVTSTTASVSWLGSEKFVKYIIRYKHPDGAELHDNVIEPNIKLIGLRQATHYTFEIDAYGANGKLLDTYRNGAFTTATEGIPMPRNLNPVRKDSSGILTWDADPKHLRYELIYRDKDGIDKTLYLTTNRAVLPSLDSMLTYPFTLKAFGKSSSGFVLESDLANGNFMARISGDPAPSDTINLEEVTIKGQTWSDTQPVFNGEFDESVADANSAENATFSPAATLNPESPMGKPKGFQSFDQFRTTVCPNDSYLSQVHQYKLYTIKHFFENLGRSDGLGGFIGGAVSETGDFIADAADSVAVNIVKFVETVVEKFIAANSGDPGRTADELFEQVYYTQTVVEFNPDLTPTPEICSPAPSWLKTIRKCELIFIKEVGVSTSLPILIVDKGGSPITVANAKQTSSGDYYYKDIATNIEYWKLLGTYLIARINEYDWIYWNVYTNKWCSFTPASFEVRIEEMIGFCEDRSNTGLGGEIKVRAVNGKGPYTFTGASSPSFTSDNPVYTHMNVGGGIVDLKVNDSKGCDFTLTSQYVQSVPASAMGIGVKLRNCNNSVVLEPICGTSPFEYSMDGKTYQKSNEFKGIQNLIGSPGACDNGIAKSFTFSIKDARGIIARKTLEIKRNDYVSLGVRKLGGQKYPGYQDEEFVLCGSGLDYKNFRHVNKSSGVLVSHTEKFCEEAKGSIRLDSKMTDNSSAPYTYRLFTGGSLIKTVTTESPGYKFVGLEPGQYRIEGENGDGCPLESFHSSKTWGGFDNQDIEIIDAGMSVQVTPNHPSCGDGTGYIDITAKGGAFKRDNAVNLVSWDGYYIPWQRLTVNNVYIDNLNKASSGPRADINFPANNFRLFRGPGSYDIKVSDYLGCAVTRKVVLTAPAQLALSNQIHHATSLTSASVSVTASGGTPPLEYVLGGPGMDEIRQANGNFTNLKPGMYFTRVVDAARCYTNAGFIIAEPLSVTATVSNTKCGDDGSVSLVTSGGLPPFTFSMGDSTFQESPTFRQLAAGTYTFIAKDGQNGKATRTVTISAPSEIVVVPSVFHPNMRVGATNADSSVTADGFVHVWYDENSRKTSFKLKEGFDLQPTSSGVWQLTVSSTDPADKKWEGKYRAYFKDCDHSLFVGFYMEDYAGVPCDTDKYMDLQGKQFCKEGWLQENILIEKLDIVILYGGGDLLNTDDVGSAGIIVDNVEDQYDSKLDIKAFDSDYWGVGLEDVTSLNIATEKAFRFIQTKLNKELESVIIYGYSWGGVLAQHLTKRLKESGITIKLLITIDAAAGPQSSEISRIISDNVEENLNIYQTEPSIIRSRGYPNTAENSQKTLIDNNDYSNNFLGTPGESDFVKTTHSTIDEMALPRVIKKILDTLNSK